jgi:thiamine kinase-like enzyme
MLSSGDAVGVFAMSEYRQFTVEDATAAARQALSRAAGYPIAVEQVSNLGSEQRRNLILRASAVKPDGASRSVIIKATRARGYDPSAADAFETSGLIREWAAVRLLAQRTGHPPAGPALLEADIERGVLVFDDLGDGLASLVQPLLKGSAAEAEQALMAYATALGELHVAAADCRAAHSAVLRHALPAVRLPQPARDWTNRIARKAADLLGETLPEQEAALIAERLQGPGIWQTLVHGDPCPDNVLLIPDGTARLIDFEFSSPGHALLDAAYWRMGFPSCWCAGHIPVAVADRMEQAYRSTLARVVPIAEDDQDFRRESALICVAWLVDSLAWLLESALREDRTWGISSNRARILHYLGTAIERMTETGVLPRIRDLAAVWQDRLRAIWPDSQPLAPFPAFAAGYDGKDPDA